MKKIYLIETVNELDENDKYEAIWAVDTEEKALKDKAYLNKEAVMDRNRQREQYGEVIIRMHYRYRCIRMF